MGLPEDECTVHVNLLMQKLNREASTFLEASRAFVEHCQSHLQLDVNRISIFAKVSSVKNVPLLGENIMDDSNFFPCVFSSTHETYGLNCSENDGKKSFILPDCPSSQCVLFHKAELARTAVYFDPIRLANTLVHDPSLWHLLYPVQLDNLQDPWLQVKSELEPVALKTECLIVPVFSHKAVTGFVYFEDEYSGLSSPLQAHRSLLMSLCELLGPILQMLLCQLAVEHSRLSAQSLSSDNRKTRAFHYLPICDNFPVKSGADLLMKKAWINTREQLYSKEISNLHEQAEHLRDNYMCLLDVLPNMPFVLDEHGLLCEFGISGLEFLGLNLEQVVGFGWLKGIHPDDRKPTMTCWRESLKKKKKFSIEHRLRNKDGTYHYFLSQARYNEKTRRWFGNAVNIGKLKQAYALAKQRESMLQMLLNYVPSMIWTATKDGSIDFFNPVFTRYTGLRTEDYLGTRWMELTNPSDVEGLRNAMAEIFKSEQPGSHEHRMRAKNGEYRWFNTKLVPLLDDASNIYKWVGMCVDIDEPKTAMLSALRSREMQSNFFSNMSHELRTPFAGVLGNLELLQGTELTFDQADLVEAAKVSTERLLGVINDILNFSKLEVGKVALEVIPFNVEDVLEDLFELLTPLVTDRNLAFYAWVDPDVPTLLKGDCNRIRQILLNLVGNSIKFCDKGCVRVRGSLVTANKIRQTDFLDNLSDTSSPQSGDKHTNFSQVFGDASLAATPSGPHRIIPDVFLDVDTNSIAFSETKGSGKSKVRSNGDCVTLQFEIYDTGIGMTQQEMVSLFEPFMQADCSTTRIYGGTGLGLSICAALVDLMGGRLQCFSVKNLGTVFRFLCNFERMESAQPDGHLSNTKSCKPNSGERTSNGSSIHYDQAYLQAGVSRTQQLERKLLLETNLLPGVVQNGIVMDKVLRLANSKSLYKSLVVWNYSADPNFCEMLKAFTSIFNMTQFYRLKDLEDALFANQSPVDILIVDVTAESEASWYETLKRLDKHKLVKFYNSLKVIQCKDPNTSDSNSNYSAATSEPSSSSVSDRGMSQTDLRLQHEQLSASRFIVETNPRSFMFSCTNSTLQQDSCRKQQSSNANASDSVSDSGSTKSLGSGGLPVQLGNTRFCLVKLAKPVWKRKLMKAILSTEHCTTLKLSSQGTPLLNNLAIGQSSKIISDSQTAKTLLNDSAVSLSSPGSLALASANQMFANRTAFVAEDNNISQTLLMKQLRKLGITAMAVDNGEKAIELYQKYPPGYFDVFFCDFHMPLVDGVDATRKIRELEFDHNSAKQDLCTRLPIVGLTADIQSEVQLKCQEAGMDTVVVKPMTIVKLQEVLTKLLA